MATISITVTGVDEMTDLHRLLEVLPTDVEVGILVTETTEGRRRYPPPWWIDGATELLAGRCSLHICGRAARQSLGEGKYDAWIARASRVQINGNIYSYIISSFIDRYPTTPFITQLMNDTQYHLQQPISRNHHLLVDGSGGRGLIPAAWHRPTTTKRTGFAGGLGPDTMARELPKILAVAKPDSWIDMEGRLRDANDLFDIDRATAAIAIARGIA